MAAVLRLDHLIWQTPDIHTSHAAMLQRYPEAWPIGNFWDDQLQSGIRLGTCNLEFLESGSKGGCTLCFEPPSTVAACEALVQATGQAEVFAKAEADSGKLALRGWRGADTERSQLICVNCVPSDMEAMPFEFFFCSYSPFLKRRLGSSNEERGSDLVQVDYGTPKPSAAEDLLALIGAPKNVSINFEQHSSREILRLHRRDGAQILP